MTETQYINKILKPFLKELGFRKIHKSSERFKSGWPDLTCISFKSKMGLTTYIEAKVYPNKLTPIQRNELMEIAQAGAPAYCFTWHPKGKAQHICQIESNGDETVVEKHLFERWWKND